jgi:hypothetical protein
MYKSRSTINPSTSGAYIKNYKPQKISMYTLTEIEKIFKLILDKSTAQILFSLKSEDKLERTIAKNLLKFYQKVKEK